MKGKFDLILFMECKWQASREVHTFTPDGGEVWCGLIHGVSADLLGGHIRESAPLREMLENAAYQPDGVEFCVVRFIELPPRYLVGLQQCTFSGWTSAFVLKSRKGDFDSYVYLRS